MGKSYSQCQNWIWTKNKLIQTCYQSLSSCQLFKTCEFEGLKEDDDDAGGYAKEPCQKVMLASDTSRATSSTGQLSLEGVPLTCGVCSVSILWLIVLSESFSVLEVLAYKPMLIEIDNTTKTSASSFFKKYQSLQFLFFYKPNILIESTREVPTRYNRKIKLEKIQTMEKRSQTQLDYCSICCCCFLQSLTLLDNCSFQTHCKYKAFFEAMTRYDSHLWYKIQNSYQWIQI